MTRSVSFQDPGLFETLPQQCLYRFPEPHGQGAFLVPIVRALVEEPTKSRSAKTLGTRDLKTPGLPFNLCAKMENPEYGTGCPGARGKANRPFANASIITSTIASAFVRNLFEMSNTR